MKKQNGLTVGLAWALLTLPVAAVEYSGNVKAAQQAYQPLKKLYCGNDKGCSLNSMRVMGDWAFFGWTETEAGGQAIARRVSGRWKIVTGGGGVMNAQSAISSGVPKAIAEQLVPVYCAWSDENTELNAEDIEYCSAWDLLVSRNMIYARHGRSFSYKPLRDYFLSWPWYHVDPNYSDDMLSDVEKANAKLIYSVEKQKGYL